MTANTAEQRRKAAATRTGKRTGLKTGHYNSRAPDRVGTSSALRYINPREGRSMLRPYKTFKNCAQPEGCATEALQAQVLFGGRSGGLAWHGRPGDASRLLAL